MHNVNKTRMMKPYENALNIRLLKYFRACQNMPVQPVNINITDESYRQDLMSVTENNDLVKLIDHSPVHFKMQRKDFQDSIQNLDIECRKRLSEMKLPEIFTFLESFVNVAPQLIRRLPFYKQALHKMSFNIVNCSKLELVQLCFYTGLLKKTSESQPLIKQCLNKINNTDIKTLTIEDLVVICNSSYKTSTKITNKKILEEVNYRILNQLSILKDDSVFVTFVKTLRFNRHYNEELLASISYTIFFNKTIQMYNFTAITHILALYADALHYDDELIKALCARSDLILRKAKPITSNYEHYTSQIRLKDVSRLLWSLGYLGYEDLEEGIVKNYLIPILKDYSCLEGFENNFEFFVDAMLSLWILEFHSVDLIDAIVTQETYLNLKSKNKKRFISRFNLLVTCIEFEKKEIYDQLKVHLPSYVPFNMSFQIQNRPHLIKIYKSLQNVSQKLGINNVAYISPIPYLNIVGIAIYDKKNEVSVYVECIDESILVNNVEYTENGLMKLKLRLMKTFKKPIVMISHEQILERTQAQVDTFLERRLKLFIV